MFIVFFVAQQLIINTTDLQIKFCKSKTHADHWVEEVELLQEKMKCIKQFFQMRSNHWMAHASTVVKTEDQAMTESMRAFAYEQVAQFAVMKAHCEYLWQYVATFVALGQEEVIPPEVQANVDSITTAGLFA
jgi:hypothetical protein